MSSRRTRSGASLGSCEPRRLRRTPVRKQQDEVSAEDTGVPSSGAGALCGANSDLGSGGQVEKRDLPKSKSKQESPKNTQFSCSNIWERLVKNDGEFLSSTAIKEDENKEYSNCTNDKAKTLLTEKVASSDNGIVKKCRKPDILVSLLEGETAYPVNQRKDAVGFKSGSVTNSEESQDNSKKPREKSVLSLEVAGNCNIERNSEAFHVSSSSICFFHNCECHRNNSLADFSDMPDVPGEPFFVSLSKDENKELNMVKTSSGTVRVGCSLRKFADHNRNYTETCTEPSLFSSTEKSRKMRMSSEHKSGKRSGRFLYPDVRFHKTRLDETKDQGWSHQSKKVSEIESEASEQQNTIIEHSDLEIHNHSVEHTPNEHQWYQEMNQNDHVSSESGHPSSEITQDKQKTPALTLLSENQFKRNDFSLSSFSKSLTPCRSSHYPLMKEILTQQNYLPLTSTKAGAKYVVNPPELDTENSDKRSLKSVKTLKPSTKSPVSFTSVLSADSESEKKSVVKRSERIRCKSGVEKPVGIALHKSVISTMKPLDRTFKDKTKLTNLKRSSKVAFGRESQRKSGKKICEHVKKATVVKDVQKGKTSMSQEVMEAIIQSIEETVSGCSEAEKSDGIREPMPTDLLVTSCSMDDMLHQNSTSVMTSSSVDSVKVDHWSDCVNDHNYDINVNSADISFGLTKNPAPLTGNIVTNSRSDKIPKMFNSKNAVRKAKKTAKVTNRSKALKVRSVRSKVKSVTINTVLEDTPSFVSSSAADSTEASDPDTTGVGAASAAYSTGKRFRKKTRKAKEAFGDDDVFSDENWAVKKSKSKTRSNSTSSDSSNSSSQRRPRRSSQVGSNIADPVLEEHAFILWASENRSQLEQQHPSASSSEVDTFLFLRWCEVADSLKAKFFLRAREAFSDDERNMIRSGSVTDLEANMCVDFFSDSEPVFTDFIRLPIERQRDMLRKWLKFFQKTLPKKEYIDFIITFKRACNRDSRNPSGGSKRTRMRCLDPSYYKMLFDMIRVTKPRVLEVFKVKQDKDKAAVLDAYSIMLLKLVTNEPMTPLEPCSKSQALTEILQDLGISDNLDVSTNTGACTSLASSTAAASSDKDRSDAVCHDETRIETDTSLTIHEWRTTTDVVNKVPLTLEIKAELSRNVSSFDESDYSLLNCDLAISLLSSLSEISELPVLDQDTLDQVFLAPPRISTAFNQLKRTVNLYGRCLENLPQNQVTMTSHSSVHVPPCLPRLLPTDQVSYPKINIQYSPSTSASVHHLPIRHNNVLPHKYTRRDTCDASSVRGGWYRKNSPMDMHTYSTSMENMIQSPAHFNGPHSKCFKVHAKVMSPQIKFNLQPMQLPINTRSHQQNRLHPRIIPVSCSLQQRFPTIIYSPTNPTLLDKLGSHHINQVGARSLSSSSATSSRISPQPIGLNTPSSLITSLSPLRSIKYSHNNKLYSPHCQMVPCRPRMQLMSGCSTGQRRATHTIPISTTNKAASSKAHGSLQQIKVCLSTQTLKIPIAKLREPRKNSYIKGKVKNFNMQHSSLEPYGSIPCTQACQFSVRANPPTSVLAKVLNFQTINEMEHLSKISLPDGLSTNTVSNSRAVNSAFIGTMKPVTVQSITKGLKPTTQLQLMSVVSSSPSMVPDVKTAESTQAAILADPHMVNRNSYIPEPMCNTSTTESNSHLSKCSFASSMYCVSLANVNTNTTQNMNVSIPNIEYGENLVCSEAGVNSEGCYADALFEHCGETDISGEFRVVGTRVINATNTVRGNSVINNDYVTETLVKSTDSMYLPDGSENISASTEHIETAKKVTSEDETIFNGMKTLFGSTTVAKTYNLECGQERSKGALTPTKMAYTVFYNSQNCVSKQSLNHGSSTVDHFLAAAQTNPPAFLLDAGHSEDTTHDCVSQNTSSEPGLALGQNSRGSLPAVSTNCTLADSQDGPRETSAADTFPVTRDIPWQCSCCACTSGKDKMCQSRPAGSSQTYTCCVSKTSEGDSDYVQSCTSEVGCVHNGDEKSKNADNNITIADGVLRCDKSVDKATSGFIGSSNITKVNADSHNGIGTPLYDLQQSKLDSSKDTSDVTFTGNPGEVCLSRLEASQLCEHEYTVGTPDMPQDMLTYAGSAAPAAAHPSGCAPGTSGLQILAETATSGHSLVSSGTTVLPADQSMQNCDESLLLSKHDSLDVEAYTPGLVSPNLGVTIHSDTGCVLVEGLAIADKITKQPVVTTTDLSSASGNSSRAAASPVSAQKS